MKQLTLRQLEYFVAVAEEESITKAAQRCHVTQANLSQAIKEIERVLGAELAIRRRSKGVYLTPTGRTFATRARALLAESRQLVADVAIGAGTSGGNLTVGCFATMSGLVMPRVAEYLAQRTPAVALEIVEGSAPEIQERMLRGQIDVCFVYEVQAHPEVDAMLVSRRTFRVVLAPDHPLAAQESVSLPQLNGYPAALLDVEPAPYLNEELLRRFGVDPVIAYRSKSIETIRGIVARNLAYSLLMEPVTATTDGRPLRFLPIAEDTGTNSLVAAHPRGLRPSGLVRDLVDFCRRDFATAAPT